MIPAALLGALFVAEDLKLVCRVDRAKDGEGEGLPLLTTVWAGVGGATLLDRAPTQWRPGTKPGSELASERLGLLKAELGVVGAGNLYELYVVRRNHDHATFGPQGVDRRAARDAARRAEALPRVRTEPVHARRLGLAGRVVVPVLDLSPRDGRGAGRPRRALISSTRASRR